MPLRVFTDIETIPPKKDQKLWLLGINPNISEDDYQRLSLQAEFGRILCIGIIVEKDGIEIKKGVFGIDTENKKFHFSHPTADISHSVRQLLPVRFRPGLFRFRFP